MTRKVILTVSACVCALVTASVCVSPDAGSTIIAAGSTIIA
jgi:hypothetical protein